MHGRDTSVTEVIPQEVLAGLAKLAKSCNLEENMSDISALSCIIPAPMKLEVAGTGRFHLQSLGAIQAEDGLERLAQETGAMLTYFGVVARAEQPGRLQIGLNRELGAEGWRLQVSPDGLLLQGGDEAGVFYALQALTQVVAAASERGPSTASIEYGTVVDSPRFAWRGLLLDSARHFQSVATVKRVLRLMATYRLNVLHWHLTDNQGWRLDTGIVPPDTSLDQLSQGCYSREDLREVAAYAKRLFISIVPEVDVPGHSSSLLHACPELACNPASPGSELCLGRPETLPFLKRLFADLMDIFPDSKYIHFGGDEAATGNWEKCPQCQAAMATHGFQNLRQLENHFMRELTCFAVDNHRIPIVWGTGLDFPPTTVIQAWLDIREPQRHIAKGGNCIMSVHTSYYLDYPAELDEYHEPWMFLLPEESLYMANPYVIWENDWKGHILGPEACLWTEYVPEWRIVQKILPRLGAFAETAWSREEQKDWHDFQRRSRRLRSAGFEEYLRMQTPQCR